MKKTSFSRLLSVVLMAAFLFGCAKAPKQEIATAKASVDAAQAIKADVFASEQFTAAKGYLDAAMAEISAQNAKSPLSRNYENSIKMLKETVAAADAAKNAVTANKAKAIADAKASLVTTLASATDLKKAIDDVSKKNKDAAALGSNLDSALTALPKDSSGVTEDNVLTIQGNIKTVGPQVESIKAAFEQLQAAKPAKGKGKKK
jgi:PBP1b-binding outer membrane lipoprotein LpoB